MDAEQVLGAIPDLSDLELAALISLIVKQPCLMYSDDELLGTLASELALIVSDIFKLSFVVLEESDYHNVDSFSDAILDDQATFANESDLDSDTDPMGVLKSRIQSVNFKGARSHVEQTLDNRMVVNVIIAKDFNRACHDVQIQVMELIRRRRIFSKTTVHPAPKNFLFLPLISTAERHVPINHHLNDRIFMSHTHAAEDGFPNVEELEADYDSTSKSGSSRPSRLHVTRAALDELQRLGKETSMVPEVRRYLQDIVVFLRMERGVDGGITPYSNVCFVDLAKYLAPLHGIDFVTPSLIQLAAKKVFPHRLTIAQADRERSTQFGSDIDAVKLYVDNLTAESVIDLVLAKVAAPL
jgi:MoxR-like ATPase